MEIKSNFLCSRGVALAFAMLLGGSPGAMLYANDSVEESLVVAQSGRTIKGLVTDANGEPLIGCNVVVVGANAGVITDFDGHFTLNVPADAKQLKVSYIGYVDQIVNLSERSDFKIVLKEDNNALEEVVVVGYGTQKKATLTGAVEQVTSKALESRAITNVGAALQGQTPGLTVTRSSSRPGNEGLNFQIRGATSVNGGSPLIIVDGVPAINGTSFQNLNTDDIESISVLKDGAASIYGAKAANGVILVTTKRGKGKATVDYNFNMRFTTNGIMDFSPSMQEYASMWIEANKEMDSKYWWNWGEETIRKMQSGYEGIYHTTDATWGDLFIGNANRLDELFARRYSYQHNLSVSGSTDKSDYRISLAYADNQANLATAYDGQKQINLRLNYGVRLTDWFKLETSASMIKTDTETPSAGIDHYMYSFDPPFFPAKNPYGQWYSNFGKAGNRNSVASTADGGREERTNLTTRVDVKALVDIWKGISFEGMASFQNEEWRRDRYITPVTVYDWFGNPINILANTQQTFDESDNVLTLKDTHNPGYLAEANNMLYQYYSALLKYNYTFANVHNVSAMAGINAEKWMQKKLAAGRENLEDSGVYDLNLANGKSHNGGGKTQNGTYSYIMKLNYNYAEKYLIELMGRRDGNSKFATGHKFKNFASASVGWVFTAEEFVNPITSVLNFGKLRASYGNSGNDVGLGDFDYLSLVNNGIYAFGSPAVSQVVASSLANGGLVSLDRSWERVQQWNFGVDLNFLDNRLTTSFDYFIKDNIGMLVNVSYPGVLGGTAPKTNNGRLQTKGWELTVSWRDQIKDFSYYANFNIGDTRNKLRDLEGADSYVAGHNKTVNGYPLNSYFLYRTDGFFKNQAEVDRYYALYGDKGVLVGHDPNGKDKLRPGDVKRLDLNGDYKIDATGSQDSDIQYLGDSSPHFVFGMNLGFTWKGIDVSAMFQGVGKQYIMRNDYMAYPFRTTYTNQNATFLGKTWTEENPGAEYPRLTTNTVVSGWNYENNDYVLQNSRYIRLKTLIIGYTLPQIWTRKVKLEKVRLYFSGNDLWEATSIRDGFDPEMGAASNSAGYPFARTWSFGLNVTL